MNDYTIQALNNKDYNVFILCLTSENLLNYIDSLEHELLKLSCKGTLLIDQLLITGNGKNRYISCSLDNGRIDFSSVKNVNPGNFYRKLSSNLLQENYKSLKYSIITAEQLRNIKYGIAF